MVSFFIGAHFLYVLNILTDSAWNIHDRPALNLGILAMIVGLQFFSIGLLGELFVTSRHNAGRDPGYSVKEILEDDPGEADS